MDNAAFALISNKPHAGYINHGSTVIQNTQPLKTNLCYIDKIRQCQ